MASMMSSVGGEGAGHRKARGAYFTPTKICTYVSKWAVRTADDLVLEPSCGEAAFLLAAGQRMSELARDGRSGGSLAGVELHPSSAYRARDVMKGAGYDVDIEIADFFAIEAKPDYDVVLGNPPYVRYQDFTGEVRSRARAATLRAGVSLTALASSWAAFTVHAAQFLRPGGRLGLVLPAELMTVNYAAAVRRFLIEQFAEVNLVMFDGRVFPGVLEEVVLLLANGYGKGPADRLTVVQAQGVDNLDRAVQSTWIPTEATAKWTPALLSAEGLAAYEGLVRCEAFSTLHEWGETTLGIVTGRNGYFVLSGAEVASWGLEQSDVVRVSPPGSRHLRRLSFGEDSWRDLRRAEQPVYLFRPTGEISASAQRYIAMGEHRGIDTAYKCRVRSPWWRVPYLRPADVLLTCMNAEVPQLCANEARVHHLNSVHGIYFREGLVGRGCGLLPIAALNTLTLVGAESVGRSYGGGILKIEPKEADGLPVPSPFAIVQMEDDLAGIRPIVYRLLQARELRRATALVDEIVLIKHSGVTSTQLSALREAHERLQARRKARGRTVQGDNAADTLEEAC